MLFRRCKIGVKRAVLRHASCLVDGVRSHGSPLRLRLTPLGRPSVPDDADAGILGHQACSLAEGLTTVGRGKCSHPILSSMSSWTNLVPTSRGPAVRTSSATP